MTSPMMAGANRDDDDADAVVDDDGADARDNHGAEDRCSCDSRCDDSGRHASQPCYPLQSRCARFPLLSLSPPFAWLISALRLTGGSLRSPPRAGPTPWCSVRWPWLLHRLGLLASAPRAALVADHASLAQAGFPRLRRAGAGGGGVNAATPAAGGWPAACLSRRLRRFTGFGLACGLATSVSGAPRAE